MCRKKKIEIDEIESVTDWFRYVIVYYYLPIAVVYAKTNEKLGFSGLCLLLLTKRSFRNSNGKKCITNNIVVIVIVFSYKSDCAYK